LNLDPDELCAGRPCGPPLIQEHLRGTLRPIQSAVEITGQEICLSGNQPSLGLIFS
jgi:hypothetical protein